MDVGRIRNVLKQRLVVESVVPLVQTDRGPIYGLVVHGREAVLVWRVLRNVVADIGLWPVIIGDERERDHLLENIKKSQDDPTSGIIERGLSLDVIKWFSERANRYERRHYNGKTIRFWRVETGEWPDDVEPHDEYHVPFNWAEVPKPSVTIALAPTNTPWEIPAVVHYGGWNDCPYPEENVAVQKRWHWKFGAEVVCIADDVVEMTVSRPPTDRTSALELAREQYVYCEDLVVQGTLTLERLAASLLGAKKWFFWWD